MSVEGSEPPVQLLAQVADQRRVVRHGRLPPAVGHRLKQGDEGRGRGNDHALAERGLEHLRALGERRGEKLIAGQEQHGKLRAALELCPVALGRELPYARLDLWACRLRGCWRSSSVGASRRGGE